ncbi:uncharacterized protein [Choristoneura fumiferana]|uniref:uncharacterized protein n=1 Tax=Choristoneura fumiferana TaxID=7141 RepID=UPI003D158A01
MCALRDWGLLVQMDDLEKGPACVRCLEGKQTAAAFPERQAKRAARPLELIHSDVCGPMSTSSMGGARYLVTFTDDFSRKTFGYLLKFKSEHRQILSTAQVMKRMLARVPGMMLESVAVPRMRTWRLVKGKRCFWYCHSTTRPQYSLQGPFKCETEPLTYDEAMSSSCSEEWHSAMQKEYDALIKNGVWSLVDRPKDANIVKSNDLNMDIDHVDVATAFF